MTAETAFPGVIQRMRAGDQDAAALIFGRHLSRLVAMARTRVVASARGKEDPEDVVQSVYRSFLQADRTSPFDLEDWDGLWAIMAVIMVRKCLDRREYWGAARRDPRRETVPGLMDNGVPRLERDPRSPTPLEIVAFQEALDQLASLFRPEQAEIVRAILQGYDGPTIAGRCGCSERTVARVAKRIRHLLEEMGNRGEDDLNEPA